MSCSFTNLVVGSTSTVRISGTAPNKGAVTATATIRGSAADPNPANDTASATVQVR